MYLALLLVLFLSLLFLFLLRKLQESATFWSSRGFPSFPYPFSFWSIISGQKSVFDADPILYQNVPKGTKFIGSLEFGTPILFVKDLDIARDILIKDFSNFFDKRDVANTEPLFRGSLIFSKGQRWKEQRSLLSPAFTSGRIRRMIPHFAWSTSNLINYVTSKGGVVRAAEVAKMYAAQVIAASVLGINANVFEDKNKFFEMVEGMGGFDEGMVKKLKVSIFQLFPNLANLLDVRIMDAKATDYFLSIIEDALKEREKGVVREDFLQIIVDSKEGKMKLEVKDLSSEEKDAQLQLPQEDKKGLKLSFIECIGSASQFFIAGFDTVSGNLNVCLAVLASRPDIQEKVFRDVEKVMKGREEINYDELNQMEYLDLFFTEVLRLYPAVSRLERKCMEDYKIRGTNLVVPKGTLIIIPAEGIQRDEAFYENPLEFNPERFSAQNKGKLHPYAYMPFGLGPRNCIGMRFAQAETKMALAKLVTTFELKVPKSFGDKPAVVRNVFRYIANPSLDIEFVPRK